MNKMNSKGTTKSKRNSFRPDYPQVEKKRSDTGFNKTIFYGILAAVTVLLLILFNIFWGQDSKDLLAQVEESLQTVYLNQDYSYLKENITQEDLNQSEQVINKLKRRNQKPYLELLNVAQSKFDSLNLLNTIYSSEKKIINGDKEIPLEQLVLRQYATIGVIEVKGQSLIELEQDPMVKSLQLYYQHAIDTLEQINQVTELVAMLPKDVSDKTEMLETISMIIEIESRVLPLIQHPQVIEIHQELLVFSDSIVEVLIEEVEVGEYDADLVEAMTESDVLSKSLAKTPLGAGPLIALTFDDGPNKTYTPQLLDVLAKHDVKATFFVRGDSVDEYPEIAKRIVKDGHIIGNHTYNHPNLSELSDKEVQNEFELTQKAIQKATGVTPDIYRLPFGVGGKRIIDLIPNMTSILWNVDSADWVDKDVKITFERIMDDLQYQTLLLMHDTHQAAPEIIDLLIPVLKEEGYTFVSPDKLEFDMQYLGE